MKSKDLDADADDEITIFFSLMESTDDQFNFSASPVMVTKNFKRRCDGTLTATFVFDGADCGMVGPKI